METKRKNIIKFLTYVVFFMLVGVSLAAAASEFTMVNALNAPILTDQNAQSEASFRSVGLLIAGLIWFLVMTQRKSI